MSDKITYWFKTGILFLTSASFASEDQKKHVVPRFQRSNCSIINDSKPTQQQSITSEVVDVGLEKACLNNNVSKQDDLASFEDFLNECALNASSVFKKESSITIEQIQFVEQLPLSLFSSKKNNSKQMVLMPVTIAKSYGKSVGPIAKKIKEHFNELSRLEEYLTVVQSPTYVPFFLAGYGDENYIERIKSTLIRGLKKDITSLNDSINVWTVLLDFARNSDEAI